jgi:hypothetical protein
LKKPGSNQQTPQGKNQKRGNSNVSRNGQNQNNVNKSSNRNSGHGRKSHEPHLWASAASSSTTLTSHLAMTNKRSQGGAGNTGNTGNTNGAGRSNGKPRSPSSYKKNGRTRDDVQKHINKRFTNDKPSSVYKKPSPNEIKTTTNTSVQEKKTYLKEISKSKTNTFGIDPFELFCAYHLGISSQNQYRPANINDVSNRFKIDIGTTRQILKEYGMDSASLLDRDFDMALAQLDIQVAPEGINRTELGKRIFEDFLEAPIKKRDWKKILEDDKKENAKTFG